MTALTTALRAFPPVGLELHADRLNADLEVQVAPGPITVYATGEGAESIRAERRGDTLRITGGPTNTVTAGGVTISGSGVFVQSASFGGDVVINGVRINPQMFGQTTPPTVHVTVPEGTPVTLTGVQGNATLGDTCGNLAVVLTGHHTVTAGQVAALGTRITGSGDVNVQTVNGAVIAEVLGSGDVRVNGGLAEHARLSVTGSGDISFNGTAARSSLSVTGSGDVYLARALNPPTRQRTGTGDIRVGRVEGGGVR